MRAPLSIVIPTLNAAAELPGTLGCLIEGLDCGLVRELIISDGGSEDATTRIADETGAVVIVGEAGRGGQLRRGRDVAKGDWLLFLHADTHLSEGWSGLVLNHIKSSQKAAYFQLKFRDKGFFPIFFARGANIRSRLGLPYGDQALLISTVLYEESGGYADIPLMEDVDIAKKLRGNLIELPVSANTSAERYKRNGWLRSGFSNMWTLMKYLSGADPKSLVKRYYR
ncbi:MAG: TIGR04283 family arsenosugar biosynthesis glycosyltransferase [Paracoccaceae bacterium]